MGVWCVLSAVAQGAAPEQPVLLLVKFEERQGGRMAESAQRHLSQALGPAALLLQKQYPWDRGLLWVLSGASVKQEARAKRQAHLADLFRSSARLQSSYLGKEWVPLHQRQGPFPDLQKQISVYIY